MECNLFSVNIGQFAVVRFLVFSRGKSPGTSRPTIHTLPANPT